MANLYDILYEYRPRRTIKSEEFNAAETATKAAFDKLGSAPLAGRQGVSTPFAVGDATESFHAISKTQFDAATGSFTGVFVTDSDYTVVAGVSTDIHMKALTANRTIYLPQNPAGGQLVRIRDSDHTGGTFTITLNRDTRNIQGAASDLSIDVTGVIVTLVYDLANLNWVIADIAKTTDEA